MSAQRPTAVSISNVQETNLRRAQEAHLGRGPALHADPRRDVDRQTLIAERLRQRERVTASARAGMEPDQSEGSASRQVKAERCPRKRHHLGPRHNLGPVDIDVAAHGVAAEPGPNGMSHERFPEASLRLAASRCQARLNVITSPYHKVWRQPAGLLDHALLQRTDWETSDIPQPRPTRWPPRADARARQRGHITTPCHRTWGRIG
jgi:hypothetical protein